MKGTISVKQFQVQSVKLWRPGFDAVFVQDPRRTSCFKWIVLMERTGSMSPTVPKGLGDARTDLVSNEFECSVALSALATSASFQLRHSL